MVKNEVINAIAERIEGANDVDDWAVNPDIHMKSCKDWQICMMKLSRKIKN